MQMKTLIKTGSTTIGLTSTFTNQQEGEIRNSKTPVDLAFKYVKQKLADDGATELTIFPAPGVCLTGF